MKIELIYAKNGFPTLVVDGYLLHSKYDPVKEASKIVEKELTDQFVHVLFGYGYGYIADLLLEKLDDSKIIIYDPLKNSMMDYSAKSNIEIIDDLNVFESVLSEKLKNYDTKVKIICSPNYNKIFEAEYKDILSIVKDVQYESIVNENTVNFFSDMWQENYIKNLISLQRSNSLEVLNKQYDCPVILASGGPSLSKQLPKLKKIKNNVIVIAAGSAINSLLAENIEPDFVVSIDGGEANYKHFEKLKLKKTGLIYSLSSQYKIQEEFIGEKYGFAFFGEDDIKKHIENGLKIKLPLIYGGGTVANSALHIATYISTGPIAIIGQDLAYTNNQSHALNNKYYKEIDDNYLKLKKAFEIEGYYEDKVYTDYSFFSMLKTFGKIYNVLKNECIIYNCTEGGAKIKPIPQISFDTFCEKYIGEEKKNELNIKSEKVHVEQMKEFLEKEIFNYNSLEKELNKALKVLEKDKLKRYFSTSTLKKMDSIDMRIKKLYKLVMMDRIVDPITMNVMKNYLPKNNETNEEKFQRVYKQNVALYSSLLVAVQKSKLYTESTLEKI